MKSFAKRLAGAAALAALLALPGSGDAQDAKYRISYMIWNTSVPFYSNLIAIGYTSAYPWAGSPTPNDFAPANIGNISFSMVSASSGPTCLCRTMPSALMTKVSGAP